MSELVAAACCSHAPTLTRIAQPGEGWARLREAYEQLRSAIRSASPDFVVVVSNDHFDNFFLDAFPTFAIGVAERYDVADEGVGGYWDGHFDGNQAASSALAGGLVEEGFDLTLCYGEVVLDHAMGLPVSLLGGLEFPPVVPLFVNSTWGPQPTLRRCWALGRAVRWVLDAWSGAARYAMLATGGLSHQLEGEGFGQIAEDFDRDVLGLLERPGREAITAWTPSDLRRGGDSASEVANWVVCAGVVGNDTTGEVLAYEPLTDALTGMGVLRFDVSAAPQRSTTASAGVEAPP